MKNFLLNKYEEVALFLLIIGSPLSSLPEKFSLPGIGGHFSNACLFIIIFFLLLECFICRSWNPIFRDIVYKKYWLILLGWNTVCLLIGTVALYGSPLSYVLGESPSKFFQFISNYFQNPIEIEMASWIGIITNLEWKLFRDYFLRLFIVIFLIRHLYHNDWNLIFKQLEKVILAFAGLLGLYSIPEIIWLWTHNVECEMILSTVNLFLYDPASSVGWYPPLLWENQLRSFCTEPGALGVIAGFLLPFLWYSAFLKKKRLSYFMAIYISFMILMTNSRAAWIIFIIEIISILCGFVIVKYPNWKKYGIAILSTAIIAIVCYVGGSYFYQQIGQESKERSIGQVFESKLSQNVTSVTTTNKRSNSARYGVTVANLYVGMKHPVFGVGQGYESLYMESLFPDFAKENAEVNNWTYYLHENGVLRNNYPNLNQISAVFSWSGIVGVILFLFLPVYGIIFYLIHSDILKTSMGITLFVAMIGQLASLMSGQFTYIYSLSLALFILYMIYWKQKINRKGNN